MTPEAEALALSLFARGLTLHLYRDLTADDSPVECDFPGYEPAKLSPDFASSPTVAAEWPAQTFTRTRGGEAETVAGWYVMRGTTRVDCCPLSSRVTVQNKGDAVTVIPRFERARE